MKLADIPDEIVVLDPDGEVLMTLKPDGFSKIIMADLATRWHQSLETTLNRMIRAGCRKMIAKHEAARAS